MKQFNEMASPESLDRAVKSLKENGFSVVVVEDSKSAMKEAASRIPEGSEVMTMTSETLTQAGIDKVINEGGKYLAVKPKLYAMDRKTQGGEMQKMGSAPDYSIGSVHAVTEDGHLMIASLTGSQIPGYAYGSSHVVFVVGTQKIVSTVGEGFKRIEQYVLPLESERAKKAYGVPGSSVNKLFIYYKEYLPNRTTVILVKEKLGF
jgi:hypothetical protein